MKARIAFQIGSIVLLGSMAWAQEAPKTELAFDYTFARYAPSASYTQGHSLNGGGGTFKFNVSQYLGIAMDLQGYNSNTVKFTIPVSTKFPSGGNGSVSGNLMTYLFGPVIKVRTPKAQRRPCALFTSGHGRQHKCRGDYEDADGSRSDHRPDSNPTIA
jgi:hypothetical protein